MISTSSRCNNSMASSAFLQRPTNCKKGTRLMLSTSRSNTHFSSSTAIQRIIAVCNLNERNRCHPGWLFLTGNYWHITTSGDFLHYSGQCLNVYLSIDCPGYNYLSP